ncbi:MAG: NAD-dependent protein deacylase [Methanobacteriaceae archaeon]|jgi:NAD-dependent deacetylase|nr:NAD-dependent protein deacylase [Candidatus Methanorudis spinitermitis]
MSKTNELKEIIANSNNIVFFGGAGVSTESGIPDFRSEDGIYKSLEKYGVPPEIILSRTYFQTKPQAFYKYYKENLIHKDAKPNDAHLAIAKLEKIGKIKAVITQNIDGLHQKSGSKNVLELHGSILRNYCMNCETSYDLDYITKSEELPTCTCGGLIKPDVVLYEEPLDNNTMSAAVDYIANAETLIIGGTSLVVYPAAGLIQYFKGENLILINKSETEYDSYANLIINDSIGKVFKEVIE